MLPDFTDPAVRRAAVRPRPVDPAVLGSFAVSTPAQERSLAALARGACVVTGQQAGLFGGPLYTVHKAASAVVDARALAVETGVPCAPVFWLQDEDHDFAEIASATLIDADGALHEARVPGVAGEEGRSVGARRLGPVDEALDVLRAALHGLPHADEVVALLAAAHGPDVSPSDAFVAGIERLFARHGLLVLRPRHPAVVAAARPIHARAVAEAGRIERAIAPGPVHVRPGSPLSFFHPDGLDGPRFRVDPVADGWRIGDRPVSADGPHSTSALLRPIVQDALLPTAAYVGGPGEVAYLAQLPGVWAAFDLPVPLIVPRARFVWIDAVARRLLAATGLTVADLAASRDALLSAGRGDGEARALRASLDPARAALEGLGVDGLEKSIARTRATLERAMDRLIARYERARSEADRVRAIRVDRLRARLAPGGLPQERVHAWPSYAARLGIDPFVDRVLASVVPFDGTLREVDV